MMTRGLLPGILLALTALAWSACAGRSASETPVATSQSGATPAPAASPTPTPDPEVLARARAAVEGFDPGQEAAFHELNTLAVEQTDLVAALAPYLEDPDPARRFAAIYLLALMADTPEEVEVLKGALDDPVFSYRVVAAGSLARLGVMESLPVLVEAVGSDALLPYSEFNEPVVPLAREALEAYTGQSFATAEEWRARWEWVKGIVRWDGARYVAD